LIIPTTFSQYSIHAADNVGCFFTPNAIYIFFKLHVIHGFAADPLNASVKKAILPCFMGKIALIYLRCEMM